MIGQIRFTNAAVPDGTTDRVMALKNLSGRALVLPVEIPHEDDYSFSVWLKCDESGSMTVTVFGVSETFAIGTAWQRVTLIADTRQGSTVTLTPGTNDEYLIYRAMLETGNKPGDWSPSPEDGEQEIKEIRQSMLELTPEAIIGTVMDSQRMTEFRQESDRVAVIVDKFAEDGVTRVHNSAVIIDEHGIEMTANGEIKFAAGDGDTAMVLGREGIDMRTAGKVNIHAQDGDGSIMFGTDKEHATFAVGNMGEMMARSMSADTFLQNGTPIPQIVVSASRPVGSHILWFLPTSTSEKTWNKVPENPELVNAGYIGYYNTYTIPYAPTDYLAGNTLFYGITVRLYCYKLASKPKRVTLRAYLVTGGGDILLGEATESIRTDGNYVTLDTMLGTANTNIMSTDGGNFTVRIESTASYTESRLVTGAFAFKARTTATGGESACSLFYIP